MPYDEVINFDVLDPLFEALKNLDLGWAAEAEEAPLTLSEEEAERAREEAERARKERKKKRKFKLF